MYGKPQNKPKDERRLVAEFAEGVLSEARTYCYVKDPLPEVGDKAARLIDLVHNVPLWLVQTDEERGYMSMFDLLELYASSAELEEEVADQFESWNETERAHRLRNAVPMPYTYQTTPR